MHRRCRRPACDHAPAAHIHLPLGGRGACLVEDCPCEQYTLSVPELPLPNAELARLAARAVDALRHDAEFEQWWAGHYSEDVPVLLTEVVRLRAENAALSGQRRDGRRCFISGCHRPVTAQDGDGLYFCAHHAGSDCRPLAWPLARPPTAR